MLLFPSADPGTRTVVGMYGRSGVSEAEPETAVPMAKAAISTEGHEGARMRAAGHTGPTPTKWDAGSWMLWIEGSMPAVCLLRNAVVWGVHSTHGRINSCLRVRSMDEDCPGLARGTLDGL